MHHATRLEMGLALPGPFGILSDRHDHPQLLVQEGHQDPQAAWAGIHSVGWAVDVKKDPRMDQLDSTDDESYEAEKSVSL